MNTNHKYTLNRKSSNGVITWDYSSADFHIHISGNTGYICKYNSESGIEISRNSVTPDTAAFFTKFFEKLYENELQQLALAGRYHEVNGGDLNDDMRKFEEEMRRFNQRLEQNMYRFETDFEDLFDIPSFTTAGQFKATNDYPYHYTSRHTEVKKNHGCIVSLLILIFWLFVIGVAVRIIFFLIGLIFSIPAFGWELGEQIIQFLKNLF